MFPLEVEYENEYHPELGTKLMVAEEAPFFVCSDCVDSAENEEGAVYRDITHLDEMDSWPTCDVCGMVFTYVQLTAWGQEDLARSLLNHGLQWHPDYRTMVYKELRERYGWSFDDILEMEG